MLIAAIARHLTSLGLVDYRPQSDGGDCFVEHLPDQPPAAVLLTSTGGAFQASRLPHDHPTFQVLVRADRFQAPESHDRADEIRGALNGLDGLLLAPGTPDEVWLVGLTCPHPPVSIGRDDLERPRHTINAQATIHAPSPHRPPITV